MTNIITVRFSNDKNISNFINGTEVNVDIFHSDLLINLVGADYIDKLDDIIMGELCKISDISRNKINYINNINERISEIK